MPDFDTSKFVGLIDRFCEAAAFPELWRDGLEEFAETLGAGGLSIGGPGSAFEPVCSALMDEGSTTASETAGGTKIYGPTAR
jgi:hypothetical protein